MLLHSIVLSSTIDTFARYAQSHHRYHNVVELAAPYQPSLYHCSFEYYTPQYYRLQVAALVQPYRLAFPFAEYASSYAISALLPPTVFSRLAIQSRISST